MLVLCRKQGERIQVGPDVCITVVRIAGGAVRLGVEAPRGVNILRTELAAELAAEPPIEMADRKAWELHPDRSGS